MYFGLGFLAACLFALMFIPLLHERAMRLASRRVEAEIPLSVAQIRADKDLLRAEFALSARRYEIRIEDLKTRLASELAELGRKTEEVNRLKRKLTHGNMSSMPETEPESDRQSTEGEVRFAAAPRRDERSLARRLADLASWNPDLENSPLVPRLDEMRWHDGEEEVAAPRRPSRRVKS